MSLTIRMFKKDFERKNRKLTNVIIEEELFLGKDMDKQLCLVNKALKSHKFSSISIMEPINLLHKYLVDKWESKKQINKQQLIQKIVEFRRFEKIKNFVILYLKNTFVENKTTIERSLKKNYFDVLKIEEEPTVYLNIDGKEQSTELGLKRKERDITCLLFSYCIGHNLSMIFLYFKSLVEEGKADKINCCEASKIFRDEKYREIFDNTDNVKWFNYDIVDEKYRKEILNYSLKQKKIIFSIDRTKKENEKLLRRIKKFKKEIGKKKKWFIKEYKNFYGTIFDELYYFDNDILYCDICFVPTFSADFLFDWGYKINKKFKKDKKYYGYEIDGEQLFLTFKES